MITYFLGVFEKNLGKQLMHLTVLKYHDCQTESRSCIDSLNTEKEAVHLPGDNYCTKC